eukprot:TRINITY_DN6959_c0_g1_i1.p1 TRINITY_DN6959_c0_g1~~TRINITY_DN6959_c0_g1_i1.p1  ORF type:complete len:279 (-),score=32.29 TRINITY_DN6959_c0_g1_i1:107-943(-)
MFSNISSSILPSCSQGPVVCNVNFQLPTMTTYSYQAISTTTKADWSTVEQTCKQIFQLVDDKQKQQKVTSNEELERAALLSLQLMANLRSVAETQQEQYKPPSAWACKSNEEPSSDSSSTSSASQALMSMHIPAVNPTWLQNTTPIPTPDEYRTMYEAQRLQQNYKEKHFAIKKEETSRSDSDSARYQMLQVWRKSQNRPKVIKSKNRQQCEKCHTAVTPQWRKGPSGPASLCNAWRFIRLKQEDKHKRGCIRHPIRYNVLKYFFIDTSLVLSGPCRL